MYSDYSSSNEEEDGYEEPSKSLFTSEAYLTVSLFLCRMPLPFSINGNLVYR